VEILFRIKLGPLNIKRLVIASLMYVTPNTVHTYLAG